jgi:hypothetical protein
VFGIYRAYDIGLLIGVFATHHWAGKTPFGSDFPTLNGAQAVSLVFSCFLRQFSRCESASKIVLKAFSDSARPFACTGGAGG